MMKRRYGVVGILLLLFPLAAIADTRLRVVEGTRLDDMVVEVGTTRARLAAPLLGGIGPASEWFPELVGTPEARSEARLLVSAAVALLRASVDEASYPARMPDLSAEFPRELLARLSYTRGLIVAGEAFRSVDDDAVANAFRLTLEPRTGGASLSMLSPATRDPQEWRRP